MPRKSKLTPEMITALSEYVAKGYYAHNACYQCGISERVLYNWLEQAAKDEESGSDSINFRLMQSLKRARATAQAEMIDVARNAAKEKRDGYLAITFLERTDPEHWGRRDRVQIDETKQITITHVEISKDYGHGKVIEGKLIEKP